MSENKNKLLPTVAKAQATMIQEKSTKEYRIIKSMLSFCEFTVDDIAGASGCTKYDVYNVIEDCIEEYVTPVMQSNEEFLILPWQASNLKKKLKSYSLELKFLSGEDEDFPLSETDIEFLKDLAVLSEVGAEFVLSDLSMSGFDMVFCQKRLRAANCRLRRHVENMGVALEGLLKRRRPEDPELGLLRRISERYHGLPDLIDLGFSSSVYMPLAIPFFAQRALAWRTGLRVEEILYNYAIKLPRDMRQRVRNMKSTASAEQSPSKHDQYWLGAEEVLISIGGFASDLIEPIWQRTAHYEDRILSKYEDGLSLYTFMVYSVAQNLPNVIWKFDVNSRDLVLGTMLITEKIVLDQSIAMTRQLSKLLTLVLPPMDSCKSMEKTSLVSGPPLNHEGTATLLAAGEGKPQKVESFQLAVA